MRPKGGFRPSCLPPGLDATPPSDDTLAAALACDLNAGFEALARTWQNRLYGFALRMTGRPGDAEDLAQETLVRAWRALGSYPHDRICALQIRPWLFQIAANLGRNRARTGSRAGAISLDTMDEEGSLRPGAQVDTLVVRLVDMDPASDPEESLDRRQRLESLAVNLLALPEPHRLALTLRHVEGLSYPEIAAVTGLPLGTVKSHVSRGAAELRRSIWRDRAREAFRMETEMQR